MSSGRLIKLPPRYKEPENPPDSTKPWTFAIIGPGARETLKYLQDLSYKIKYKDYLTLKAQEFERCRLLAVSDEFEDVSDELREEMLRTHRGLQWYRDRPEYARMRDTLRDLAPNLYEDHGKDGKDWLEENKDMAFRELIRSIRDGADSSPGAAKLMQEIMERVLPAKASRTMAEGAVIRPTPEFEELLRNALDVSGRAAEKKEDDDAAK